MANLANLEASIRDKNHQLVIAMFYLQHCPSCRFAKPIFDKFSANFEAKNVKFFKIEVGETAENAVDRFDLKVYY